MSNLHNEFRSAVILIADDDPTQLILLRAALEQGGFAVVEAKDGAEAYERYLENKPDLVLLDVNMPEMDGYGVCQKIRDRQDGKELPIVMVTGLDDIQSIDRAYSIGATDFISKPVTLPTLCYRVRYLLKSSKAFAQLSRSKANLSFAQRVAEMGNWMLEMPSCQLTVSEEINRLLGLDAKSGIDSVEKLLSYVHPDDQKVVNAAMQQAIENKEDFKQEHRIIRSSGQEIVVEQQASTVTNDEGEVTQVHGIVHNITARKEVERKIRQLAYYDPLTGLPNRQLFRRNIQRLIKTSHTDESRFALLFVDLDNFKDVNDTLGHSAGDCLLQMIADYIHEGIRASDFVGIVDDSDADSKDAISRLGGDEFTILLPNLGSINEVSTVAQRVLDKLQKPIEIEGNTISVTGSIGVAVYPYDGEEADALLKNADIAMYHAKQSGKNKFRFFDWEMNDRIMARVRMESDLRKALTRKEFSLHYQPKIELSTGKVTGVEALLRWSKADVGPISPMDFIPVAEESGLIVPIGEWVIEEACEQARRWKDQGLAPFVLSVNLSPVQFHSRSLADVIAKSLKYYGIEPEYFELELTESAVMENVNHAIRIMDALKRLGVRLSIDDFGTGYSSMEYLKRFPVDVLKIDRSFVQDITTDESDAAIIKAIIALSQALNLVSIAEGVETSEQIDFLVQHNCDEVQGYFYSRPLPEEEITEYLLKSDLGNSESATNTVHLEPERRSSSRPFTAPAMISAPTVSLDSNPISSKQRSR